MLNVGSNLSPLFSYLPTVRKIILNPFWNELLLFFIGTCLRCGQKRTRTKQFRCEILCWCPVSLLGRLYRHWLSFLPTLSTASQRQRSCFRLLFWFPTTQKYTNEFVRFSLNLLEFLNFKFLSFTVSKLEHNNETPLSLHNAKCTQRSF